MYGRERTPGPLAGSPAETEKEGRAVWLGLAVAAAVVVLAAVGVCAAAHGSQRIFSGTEVLGVELGGLTREQAQERWLERGAPGLRRYED